MSNTTLAYYKVKSPASILNSRYRFSDGNRPPVSPLIRAASGSSLRTIALRLSISALILLLAGLAQAQRPAAATHIVQPGETLGLIAQSYGIDIGSLASANGIGNAHLIRSWQRLTIPGAAAEQSASAAQSTHVVQYGESLGTIAAAYGISLYELQAANNVWSWIIYAGQELAIPAGGTAIAAPEETASPDDSPTPVEPSAPIESSGMTHKVRFGETLGVIARDYGVSLNDLQALNEIWSWVIYVGQELKIPAGGTTPAAPDETASPDEESTPVEPSPAIESSGMTHKVRFGETLGAIARDYGVSLDDLQALNEIWTGVIYVGQELDIPVGGGPLEAPDLQPESAAPVQAPEQSTAARAATPSTHTVKPGENLFRIAQRYGLTVDALVRANGIADVRRIHAGLVLRISNLTSPAVSQAQAAQPAPAPANPAAAPSPAPPTDPNRKRYQVQRGDSLSEIGERFHINWVALAEFNGIADPNNLKAGTVLLLPTVREMLRYLPDDSNVKRFYTSSHHPGPHVGVGREIVVELGRQSAYAYENGVLMRRALIASGKSATPTLEGDYNVWLKRRSQTMSGPGYSLDNVEWVMYFYQEYAMHGTWWHANFGTPTSHGCVNMTNEDAKWFYNFATIGTPVYVRA